MTAKAEIRADRTLSASERPSDISDEDYDGTCTLAGLARMRSLDNDGLNVRGHARHESGDSG